MTTHSAQSSTLQQFMHIGLFSSLLFVSTQSMAASTQPANAQFDDSAWLENVLDVEAFLTLYDKNKDKLLSPTEVTQAVAYELHRADSNGDRKISLHEFEPHWQSDMQTYMRAEFQSIDNDKSNDLTLNELTQDYFKLESRLFTQRCLKAISTAQERQQEAQLELIEMDTDRNQRVSYAEFSVISRNDMIQDFRDLDTNNDGHIDQREWQLSMQELAKEAATIKREAPMDC